MVPQIFVSVNKEGGIKVYRNNLLHINFAVLPLTRLLDGRP